MKTLDTNEGKKWNSNQQKWTKIYYKVQQQQRTEHQEKSSEHKQKNDKVTNKSNLNKQTLRRSSRGGDIKFDGYKTSQ